MVPRSDCPNTEPDSAAHRTIAANEKRTRILSPLPTKTKQSDVCSAAKYDFSTHDAPNPNTGALGWSQLQCWMARQSRATTPLHELIERAAFLLTRRFKTCQT